MSQAWDAVRGPENKPRTPHTANLGAAYQGSVATCLGFSSMRGDSSVCGPSSHLRPQSDPKASGYLTRGAVREPGAESSGTHIWVGTGGQGVLNNSDTWERDL